MKRFRSRRKLIAAVAAIVLLVAAHAAGLHAMARFRIVETLLSPGPHSPLLHVLVAVLFVAARLTLILLGPGMLLVAIVYAIRHARS